MAYTRTIFSLSEVADRWTRLFGEPWTAQAVLNEAKNGNLLIGLEIPEFQGIPGRPVDSIETQEELDKAILCAARETGKSYIRISDKPIFESGFFWVRGYGALLDIEYGQSFRKVVTKEKILINPWSATRPIIETVPDLPTSIDLLIVRIQEIEAFEQAYGVTVTNVVPTKEPRTRTDRLGEAIAAALAELRQCLGREPTDPELHERLRPGRDTTGAVVDENDSGLIWTDSQGKSQTTNHEALTRRFRRMRSRDQ